MKHFVRAFINTLITFFRLFCYSTITVFRGKRTKNKKINEDILVVANGPSLQSIDIEKMAIGKEVLFLNTFITKNTELFFKIKPKYYALIDNYYFDKANKESLVDFFLLFEKIDWDITFITFQKYVLPVSNPHIKYEYISKFYLPTTYNKKTILRFYNKNLINCGTQNVAIVSIYYFVLHNANNIYVCGLDMNEFLHYTIDENNEVWGHFKHFYGEEHINQTKAGYIKKGEFNFWLKNYTLMFDQLYDLAQFATYKKVKVYNLSLESFVDVFDKLAPEKAIYDGRKE